MEKRFCTSTPIVPHNNNSNMKTLKFTQCTLNAIAARLAQESEPRVLRCGAHVSSYPARFHDWTTWLLMVLHRCQPCRHVRLHAETRQVCVPQPSSRLWSVKRWEGRALPRGGHCSHAIHSVQGTHTRTQECTQETQTTLIKHVFFPPTVLTAVSFPLHVTAAAFLCLFSIYLKSLCDSSNSFELQMKSLKGKVAFFLTKSHWIWSKSLCS